MGFISITSMAQRFIDQRVTFGDTVIDATMGNGVDTVYLAELVGAKGNVYAFDIQQEALQQTAYKLEMANLLDRCTLILQSHHRMMKAVSTHEVGNIAAIMFNLGYLPAAAHKHVITRAETTIPALEASLRLLKDGGVLTVVVYPGHAGGDDEAKQVHLWAEALPSRRYQVVSYQMMNKKNPAPYLIAIEKGTMKLQPYPLLFHPEMKERVWGGRSLTQFGFELPEGPIGEAWTIGDHANGTTKIANGPWAGQGLDEIRANYAVEVFGTKGASTPNGRFPLLVKLLDCQDDLSIQVHPDDHYERLTQGELGKTEMWYILDAKPDATIIYGLKPGTDRTAFAAAIEEKRILDVLEVVPVQTGDSFYLPAGTVHALKAGVLVAEIQQNSDTTYRVHDYDRPGLDGKPRELHIEDSLNVTHYGKSQASRMTTELHETQVWLTLAKSPYFHTEKGIVDRTPWHLSTTDESFVIHIICEGEGTIQWANKESLTLRRGHCILVPASLGAYTLQGNMTVLRCTI